MSLTARQHLTRSSSGGPVSRWPEHNERLPSACVRHAEGDSLRTRRVYPLLGYGIPLQGQCVVTGGQNPDRRQLQRCVTRGSGIPSRTAVVVRTENVPIAYANRVA